MLWKINLRFLTIKILGSKCTNSVVELQIFGIYGQYRYFGTQIFGNCCDKRYTVKKNQVFIMVIFWVFWIFYLFLIIFTISDHCDKFTCYCGYKYSYIALKLIKYFRLSEPSEVTNQTYAKQFSFFPFRISYKPKIGSQLNGRHNKGHYMSWMSRTPELTYRLNR